MILFLFQIRKQTLYQVELNYDQQVHLWAVDHHYFVEIQVVEMAKELEEVWDELR
jgi:hypothetical protein